MRYTLAITIGLTLVIGSSTNAYGSLVINEVAPDTSINDGSTPGSGEWIELYNGMATPVTLTNYTLTDGDWTITFGPATVNAGGFYLIGYDPGIDATATPDLDLDSLSAGFSISGSGAIGLTNSGEHLLLKDSTGTNIDGLQWGPPSAGNSNADAASFATITTDGLFNGTNTIARTVDGAGEWAISDTATPGASNPVAVPEPSALLLLAFVGMAVTTRKYLSV